jgi:hypothetical protein
MNTSPMNHRPRDIFPNSPFVDHPDNSVNRKLITLNPLDCREILKTRNNSNRSIRRNVVIKIKTDIEQGRYLPTHQAIAFDETGNLQDGQHRLLAISMADIPVQSWVQFNQSRDYFKVLDSGTARMVSDNLHHAGVLRSSVVAAGMKNVILYKRCPDRTWTNIPMPSASEVLDLYRENSQLADVISLASLNANKKYKLLNKTALFAISYLLVLHGYTENQVLTFCDCMASGVNLHETSPILAYRNFLANSAKPSRSYHLQQFSLNCMIKVWNYSLTNQHLKQFKTPTTLTPMQVIIPAVPQTTLIFTSKDF